MTVKNWQRNTLASIFQRVHEGETEYDTAIAIDDGEIIEGELPKDKMTIAEEYFEQQLKNPEFRLHYINKKEKLDIEYMLEELKQSIINKKPTNL
ncbi:MAG: hypothetical protein ACE5GV_05870 [Candidatus Scalindua sp.]